MKVHVKFNRDQTRHCVVVSDLEEMISPGFQEICPGQAPVKEDIDNGAIMT